MGNIYNVHAGHCPSGKGAFGAMGILDESKEARLVKDEVIRLLCVNGHTSYDCTCDIAESRNGCLRYIVNKCNQHKVDLDISIHLNAGRNDYKGDNSTGGTEVFCYNEGTIEVAKRIVDNIANTFNYRKRNDNTTPYAGVKINKNLYVLNQTVSPAILIECCFVDDKDDAKVWNAQKCAKAIVEGILNKEIIVQEPTSPQKPVGEKYSIGDRVKVSSYYASSDAPIDKAVIKNAEGTITRIVKGARNPYLLENGKIGWCNDGDIRSKVNAVEYYKAFNNTSIVNGLRNIGVNSSFSNRKKIASANGIGNYSGTASENNKLCSLARVGKLKKYK